MRKAQLKNNGSKQTNGDLSVQSKIHYYGFIESERSGHAGIDG